MPPATPGKWYISVVCECSHRILLFPDLNEGKSHLGRTLIDALFTCASLVFLSGGLSARLP